MRYTFGFTFKKFGIADVTRNKGHNLRLHQTSSQLQRKEAWFTQEGHHTIVEWDDSKIEKAKGLAKRKDAVVAIGFSIQLGAQTDWRDPPTEDFPEGKPRSNKAVLNKMYKGARDWAVEAFGKDNLVSVEVHTDESTPHVQLVVTPINDGKLQAKHWLNGGGTCATLRRKACDVMNRYVDCYYTPGNPGGEPHDPNLSAGAKAAPEKKTVLDRVFKNREKELEHENLILKEQIRALEQALFSRKKGHYTQALIEKANAEAEEAKNAMQNALGAEGKAKRDLVQLQDDFSRRGTALSNAAHKVQELENSTREALATALEWKAKHMQERIRANYLGKELQDRELELNNLKKEIRGDDETLNPFKH